MIRSEWSADSYVDGNTIQRKMNDVFLANINLLATDAVLDIGCGDGSYTHKIATQLAGGHIIGIDEEASMIEHAIKQWQADNIAFKQMDCHQLNFSEKFDHIVSFWCLHWTNYQQVIELAYQALKPGGHFHAIFYSGLESSLTEAFDHLATQQHYPDLAELVAAAKLRRQQFYQSVKQSLTTLPYKHCQLSCPPCQITLDDISEFEQFVRATPILKHAPVDKYQFAIDKMTEHFLLFNQGTGQLIYHSIPFYIHIQKPLTIRQRLKKVFMILP